MIARHKLRAADKKAAVKKRKALSAKSSVFSINSHLKRKSSSSTRNTPFSLKNTFKALCVAQGISGVSVMAREFQKTLQDQSGENFLFSCKAEYIESCLQLMARDLHHPNITVLDDSSRFSNGTIIGNFNCTQTEATLQQFDNNATLSRMGAYLASALEHAQEVCLSGGRSLILPITLMTILLFYIGVACVMRCDKKQVETDEESLREHSNVATAPVDVHENGTGSSTNTAASDKDEKYDQSGYDSGDESCCHCR